MLLWLGALWAPATAAPRDDIGLAQFGVQRWDADDGLGGNWVRDLVEDADGRIWVGTGIGLSRFDGSTFAAVGGGGLAALPQRSVSALARGGDGRLWVGLACGGVRRLGADGGPDEAPPPLPETLTVHDLLEDPRGTLWIATGGGLWRRDAAGLRRVAPDDDARAADVRTVVADAAGAVWARTRQHGLWRIDGEHIALVRDAPDCLGYGLAIGPDGERFMSCQEGIWHAPAGSDDWRRISAAFGVGPVHLDRRGDLWFGAGAGLARWSKGAIEWLPPERGIGDWRVRAIAEDRRGDIWIGSFSGGLARLHRGPVQTTGAPEGLAIDGTTAVLDAPDGDVWVGALRAGVMRVRPGAGLTRRWTARDGLPGETAWALAADPRDPLGVWVGADAGLAWLADGRLRSSGPGGESFAGAVSLVHVDPGSPPTVWVAGPEGGLVALRGSTSVVHDAGRGMPLSRVRFLRRDRAGRLLAGGAEGLFALDGERWARHQPGGLQVDTLTAAVEDAEGNLWLASSRVGLVRVARDGHTTWTLDEGLPFWPLHSLAFDRAGGLWMSSNDGLARLRLDDHARWRAGELASIPTERLGRRDGLRDVETNGWGYPAHAAFGDGRLVYPSALGIAVLDPTALPSVGLSPAEIYLRAAWAGTRALDPAAPVHLSRDECALRIAFSAIELRRPEAVSFRYRLEGVDRDWVAAGSAAEAAWSGLPPGDFRFLLQARLPGQQWIDAAQVLPVRVEPLPWESTAVRLAVLATLLLLAVAAVRWRLRVGSRHASVLRRARSFLREVIDTSPNPIFVRDRNGAYTLANRAAAEVYHRSPEALEGRTPRELGATPPGMARIEALDAEVIASGEERVLPEQEIIDGDGRRRWFRVVKRPGFGADGRTVEQVIGTAVDVTDFRLAGERLEHEQVRLRRSREEARALSHQLLRAQEDERRRLAREIHDDLTQQLAGLAMLAWSTAQAATREPGGDRREALEHLARGLEKLANDVQSLSRDLHPPALEVLGLAEALRAECATFGQRTGLPIECVVDPQLPEPPADVGLALYRIAQEALRNCLAHAHAGRVGVGLRRSDHGLRLEIADDGIGFDAAGIDAGPGIGLSGMRERARLAGAALAIDSARG
ncbi:MAG: two-component regulator propeller domain-containing protein, partial [Pseudomonadota bacterium]